MDVANAFRGKRITLMGLGLLGRGVGDARFLASCGADLTVTDLRREDELEPSVAAIRHFPNVRLVLGRHEERDFTGCDLVVKAAGVPLGSPYVAAARRAGVPVRMSADLFAELSGVPIVGVTGTRGKTTTTYLIRDMLEAAGVRTLLGGNILGVSTLALLPEAAPGRVAVLELDSWQLQGFATLGRSPEVAVFTTFYDDHQHYYRHNMAAYLADKANIFLRQGSGATLVVGEQAMPAVARSYPDHAARAVVARAEDVAGWSLPIPGAHSRANLACAAAAVAAQGVGEATARRAASTFAGVPWRLELVSVAAGVRVYNDTAAVTPEATLAGIEALSGSPLIAIVGGNDKGASSASLEELAAALRPAKLVALLPGSGSDRLSRLLPAARRCAGLEEATSLAFASAAPGDVVLFSPGFSSKGFFENVFDRGERFNRLAARYRSAS